MERAHTRVGIIMYDATARRAVGGIKTLEKKITRGGGEGTKNNPPASH